MAVEAGEEVLDPAGVAVADAGEERLSGGEGINTGESPVGVAVGTTVVVSVLVRGTVHDCGPQEQLFRVD